MAKPNGHEKGAWHTAKLPCCECGRVDLRQYIDAKGFVYCEACGNKAYYDDLEAWCDDEREQAERAEFYEDD